MSSVQGLFIVTAMAAVSGTAVVLLALKLHRSQTQGPPSPGEDFPPPRPCISSSSGAKKSKKKVSFAKDVVEPAGNNEDFRRRVRGKTRRTVLQENRSALYNGIMRNRHMYRVGCSN